MATTLQGKAPGTGAGEMSRRTARLRPAIGLSHNEIKAARDLRRAGREPAAIASDLDLPLERVERALLQMRSARPESTRGTVNVTLTAHRVIMDERDGDEPLWRTMDRLLGELLAMRKRRRDKPAPQAEPAPERQADLGV